MIITLAFPFLLVGLLEMGLRVGGYGPDLSLFTRRIVGGRSLMIMNPDVKARYFSRVQFTPNISYDSFPENKSPGAFRIFCLGGSTTAGFPYGHCGSFSSWLRNRLQTLFPERTIEVVNLGMTATNSFTVLDIARELESAKPDLIIVYDGHNEFYGALGSASRESVGQRRWLTEAYLWLVHSRVFLLARDLYARLIAPSSSGPAGSPAGTMMERLAHGQHVPLSDPTYSRTLQTFRENLGDLASFCSAERIPLILSTQVSNLRHQPPFISGPSPAGNDVMSANAWYRRGQSADARAEFPEARSAYIRARDLDQLRFRTSSDFNDAIRSFNGRPFLSVVDIEQVFAAESPDSIVGRELILEHLHPNSHGYFLMAKAYAGEIRKRGLIAAPEVWTRRDTIGDRLMLEHPPLTPLDELAARRRIEILTSAWPFTSGTSPVPPRRSDDPLNVLVEQLVMGELSWEEAHVAAARSHEAAGDTAAMLREYQVLVNQLPYNVSAYTILAQFYVMLNRLPDAEELLTRSLGVEEGFLAHRLLGGLALRRGQLDSAILHLQKSLLFGPGVQERSEAGYLIAVAYRRAGRVDEARSALREVLRSNPTFTAARNLLNRLGEGAQ